MDRDRTKQLVEHTNKINLTDSVSVVMRYPTIKTFSGIKVDKLTAEDAVDMTSRCIYQVENGVETYEAADLSKEEKQEFIENLTQDQFANIQKFFTTMPKLSHTVTLTHPKTKKKAKYKSLTPCGSFLSLIFFLSFSKLTTLPNKEKKTLKKVRKPRSFDAIVLLNLNGNFL